MNSLFTSTGFLRFGGIVLLVVGVAGVLGLPGLEAFALTGGENVAHLALGVVGAGAGSALANHGLHRLLTITVFATAVIFTVVPVVLPSGGAFTAPSTFANPNFLGLANLENPADAALHLVVAAWAGLALWMERRAPAMATAPAPR